MQEERLKKLREFEVRCSFCWRPEEEVGELVRARSLAYLIDHLPQEFDGRESLRVSICAGCNRLCGEIFEEQDRNLEDPEPSKIIPFPKHQE